MAKEKPLHTDHEGIKVIAHNKRESIDGQEAYDHVRYNREGYKDIRFPYLTGVEAAALILGGIRIEKCYVSELRVEHFIDAKRILKDKQSPQKLLAWFEDHLPFFSSKVKQSFDENISGLDSVFSHPAIDLVGAYANAERIRKHMEGQRTLLHGSISFLECILAEIHLGFIHVEGFVSFNRSIDTSKIGKDISRKPDFLPTLIFGLSTYRLETINDLDLENCVVYGSKDINHPECRIHGTIGETLGLEHCTFHETVRFAQTNGLSIKGQLWAQNSEFHSTADFEGLLVEKEAYFQNAKFMESTIFDKAVFNKEVSFISTEFAGDARFEKATFKGQVAYAGSKFQDKAQFNQATFRGSADFTHAVFNNGVAFIGSKFFGVTDFRNAQFHRPGFLSGVDIAQFHRVGHPVSTSIAKWMFRGAADFTDTIFTGKTFFSGAVFSNDAYFERATFTGEAYFYKTTICNRAYFKKCAFRDISEFQEAVLVYGNFRSARFEKSCDMRFLTACRIDFTGSVFCERLLLSGRQKDLDVVHNGMVKTLRLHKTWLEEKLTELQGIEESRKDIVMLQKQDILEMAIREVDEYILFVELCRNNNWALLDVDFKDALVQGELRCSFSELEPRHGKPVLRWNYGYISLEAKKQYAWLKEQYHKQGAYEDEDYAHWWASEFARQAIPTKRVDKRWLGLLYKEVFGYGVRPWKVIRTIGIVLIVSFLIYWLVGYSKLSFTNGQPPTCLAWLNAAYFSVITYATVGYGDVSPLGWLVPVAMVEGLLGVILNAALIIVIFRKLIR